LWHHEPWVSVPQSTVREVLGALKQSVISGYILLKDFRRWVYIGDVLQRKRLALNQHKSQMTRLVTNPRWQTLKDISNGEFLECFFQEREIFHVWEHAPERKHFQKDAQDEEPSVSIEGR
jgi:hypothetical protein